MAKKTFELGDTLAEVLGKVSESDTPERLIYVPYDKLVGDAENGYSMSGLDELARSIETVGLLQPLRVYEIKSSDGCYKITSGHRRHAAIGKLIAAGSVAFEQGIPCIEDLSEASPALRELKLLLANADNRKMTPADEAQQAERISDCIRRLEDEGFDFPGRHRDWVAKLSGLSRTKLATLAAIKNNLVPELLERFSKNELNQSAAYELQKLPESAQQAIAKSCKQSGDACWITLSGAEHCSRNAEKFMAPMQCPDGEDCDHHERRFVQALREEYSWARCDGGCCLKCHERDRCNKLCEKAARLRKVEKAEEKEKKEKDAAKQEKLRQKQQKEYRTARQRTAQRLLPLIEKAGLCDDDTVPGKYYYEKIKVSEIRKAAAGDFGSATFYNGEMLTQEVGQLAKVADKLGCSLDYLAGRTDEPAPAAALQQTEGKPLQFRSGTPDHDCVCWCAFSFGNGESGCQAARWMGGKWHFYSIGADIDAECVGWIELPDYEGVLLR